MRSLDGIIILQIEHHFFRCLVIIFLVQVWQQYRIPHSQLLASQGGVRGGGLRFPASRVCIIEVWSSQQILDSRCNRSVISRRLLSLSRRHNFVRSVSRSRIVPGLFWDQQWKKERHSGRNIDYYSLTKKFYTLAFFRESVFLSVPNLKIHGNI